MNFLDAINPFKPIVEKLVDRLVPDKNKRAEAQEEIEKLLVNVHKTAIEGNLAINQQEAAHRSIWVAGWRPGIGWTCAVAFFYSFVAQPFLSWGLAVYSQFNELPFDPSTLPSLDTGPLFSVMMGMLGLGSLRTFEKLKGISK